MAEVITDYGVLAGLCGHDGSDWLKALIDAAGHLQIDLVDSGGANLGDLETLLTEIQARLGDETDPAAGTVNKQLADILTAAEKIDDLQGALDSVGTDELDVNVESSVLPSGAATSANQDTMITALQLIDNLCGALDSVSTDELDVNIEDSVTLTVQSADGDKIFGFESIVEEYLEDTDLDVGTNTLDGTAVGSGKVWRVTQIMVKYIGTSPTKVTIHAAGLAYSLILLDQLSPTSGLTYTWEGEIFMQQNDYVQAQVTGATAGDNLYLRYAGVQMDAP